MPRLLIVEDSPTQAQALRLILESAGYEVESAADGVQGLARFSAGQYDLVLSDVLMPGLTGYDLCRQIKQDPKGKETPLILLTTLSDPMDIIRGLECGADNYLTKPYEPDYLLARVRSVLANKALRNEQRMRIGIDLFLMGRRVTINSEKEQILDLLMSTFEELVRTKEKEQERRVAEETARRSQKFLQSALDALAAQICVLDHSGAIVAVNEPWRRFAAAHGWFGTPGIVGTNYLQTLDAYTGAHGDEVRAAAQGIHAVLQEKSDEFALDVPYPILPKQRWFNFRVTRLDEARPARVVIAHTDITERKQLEEQYRQAQKMEAVGRLAGGVAHDFNNLLTIITGYSELLLGSLHQGDPLCNLVGEIKRAGERAAGLTRQLLAFSRKQVLVMEVLDLNALLVDMEKMLRRLIGEDLDLTVSRHPQLGKVKGDPGQLEQVVMNLVVNARDAMPKGGKLTLETANVSLDETYRAAHPEAQPGVYVRLAVSDTGSGMDQATQARIFEPFFSTKGEKGTGLGLATVYGIVKQSGGHVEVYSEPGLGTTFKIYLPRVNETTAKRKSHPELSLSPRGKETVLLVEDEDSVRVLARIVLQKHGYAVLEARSGGDALLLCRQYEGPIQLLITDVVMPTMSGRQLAEQLNSLRPELRVLYMSGYTDDAIVHHGVLEAGTPFLQKPFTTESLARKVREVLDLPAVTGG